MYQQANTHMKVFPQLVGMYRLLTWYIQINALKFRGGFFAANTCTLDHT